MPSTSRKYRTMINVSAQPRDTRLEPLPNRDARSDMLGLMLEIRPETAVRATAPNRACTRLFRSARAAIAPRDARRLRQTTGFSPPSKTPGYPAPLTGFSNLTRANLGGVEGKAIATLDAPGT